MSDKSDRVEERILENGYEDVVYLKDYDYDTALIGITDTNQAVYDYELMIEWLVREEGFSEEDAMEWIDYNTLRALPYMGTYHPLILFKLI